MHFFQLSNISIFLDTKKTRINKYKLFNYIISMKYHILNFKNKYIVKLWKQIKNLNMIGEKFEKNM